MRINHITSCLKSRDFGNYNEFKEHKTSLDSMSRGKVRYKHYEELCDEALRARSILKAQQEVENGGKMRLYKAAPIINSMIAVTGLTIAQSKNVYSSMPKGLGFLVPIIDTLFAFFMADAVSMVERNELAKSMNKDMFIKSEANYQKGKEIQKIARAHFDSIDAVEV